VKIRPGRKLPKSGLRAALGGYWDNGVDTLVNDSCDKLSAVAIAHFDTTVWHESGAFIARDPTVSVPSRVRATILGQARARALLSAGSAAGGDPLAGEQVRRLGISDISQRLAAQLERAVGIDAPAWRKVRGMAEGDGIGQSDAAGECAPKAEECGPKAEVSARHRGRGGVGPEERSELAGGAREVGGVSGRGGCLRGCLRGCHHKSSRRRVSEERASLGAPARERASGGHCWPCGGTGVAAALSSMWELRPA